jgi:hypothetical protein
MMTATSEGQTGSTVVTAGAVLVGAGDIAECPGQSGATAALLDSIPGTVFAAGDNAYPDGSLAEFQTCYDPTWGRHKARTTPAPGNHDYITAGAPAYYSYFGAAAGDSGKGYYSYDLGTWHVVVINSEITVSAGSVQEQWVRADLAASAKRCTLAIWHRPRFSSGTEHGSAAYMQAMWQALYDYGVEIAVSGHEHNYERFAPQNAAGAADSVAGIRAFVVGTGGAALYNDEGTPLPNSQVFSPTTWGVLKFTLYPGSYAWQFVPAAGGAFTDSGTGSCH